MSALPWTGPTVLAVRPFQNNQEADEATFAALRGLALSARPDLWQPYAAARPRVLQTARPASQLLTRFPARAAEVEALLQGRNRTAATTAYLPMVGRKSFWTAFIDPVTADVVAFMPLDSF